jgi:hypothetical protein
VRLKYGGIWRSSKNGVIARPGKAEGCEYSHVPFHEKDMP